MKIHKNITPIIITSIFFVIACYSLVDDILYLVSRRMTVAKIIEVDKLPVSKPYKISLVYYNEYSKHLEYTNIDNIDIDFGNKLKIFQKIGIYYRNLYPKEVYFIDYKSPTYGYLFLSLIFFLILALGIVVLIMDR